MSKPIFPPVDRNLVASLAAHAGLSVPEECMAALCTNLALLARHATELDGLDEGHPE